PRAQIAKDSRSDVGYIKRDPRQDRFALGKSRVEFGIKPHIGVGFEVAQSLRLTQPSIFAHNPGIPDERVVVPTNTELAYQRFDIGRGSASGFRVNARTGGRE